MSARMLRMVIQVEDDGGDDSYDTILQALRSVGAEIVDEEEVF